MIGTRLGSAGLHGSNLGASQLKPVHIKVAAAHAQRADTVVVNFSAPELNHLAASLAETKLLRRYVRPYANFGRLWERAIEKTPGLNRPYLHTLGRRRLPAALNPQNTTEVAVLADFAGAGARKVGKFGRAFANALQWNIQKQVAAVAAAHSLRADIVVSSYVVSLPSFERTGGLKVLNYPIAHHRYIQEFLAEEAALEPEFSSTLPDWGGVPSWVEPWLDDECNLADRILVGSSFARDSFLQRGFPLEKLQVIPYGVNVHQFAPASEARMPSEDFRVLFVGQIGQRKGISYLLRAYRRFRSKSTRLTLVGDFAGDAKIFGPFRDSFHHFPHVPHGTLAAFYRDADVFVFPTLIEGMPLVVLEAMASGLPVITTPNGPGDLVRDHVDGFVVPIRSVDSLIEKLEYLRANPEIRLQMGKHARERALTFTWGSYQEKASAFIRELRASRDGDLPPTL